VIVVDTNVIAYLWVPNDRRADVHALLERHGRWFAPILWRSEFRNILAGYLRRCLLGIEDAQRACDGAAKLLRWERANTQGGIHTRPRRNERSVSIRLRIRRHSKCPANPDCDGRSQDRQSIPADGPHSRTATPLNRRSRAISSRERLSLFGLPSGALLFVGTTLISALETSAIARRFDTGSRAGSGIVGYCNERPTSATTKSLPAQAIGAPPLRSRLLTQYGSDEHEISGEVDTGDDVSRQTTAASKQTSTMSLGQLTVRSRSSCVSRSRSSHGTTLSGRRALSRPTRGVGTVISRRIRRMCRRPKRRLHASFRAALETGVTERLASLAYKQKNRATPIHRSGAPPRTCSSITLARPTRRRYRALGTDSRATFERIRGFDMHRELELLVASGLTSIFAATSRAGQAEVIIAFNGALNARQWRPFLLPHHFRLSRELRFAQRTPPRASRCSPSLRTASSNWHRYRRRRRGTRGNVLRTVGVTGRTAKQ